MKIYTVKVETVIVVEAENVEQALHRAMEECEVDGATSVVSSIIQVRTCADLPPGWTGRELPFTCNDVERPICDIIGVGLR